MDERAPHPIPEATLEHLSELAWAAILITDIRHHTRELGALPIELDGATASLLKTRTDLLAGALAGRPITDFPAAALAGVLHVDLELLRPYLDARQVAPLLTLGDISYTEVRPLLGALYAK